MLALRLVRGARPSAVLRRLLVACATGGVGFLLLSTLNYATAHPERSGEAVGRLLWCLVPLAATVQLAVAVARTEQGARARSGLRAAGLGSTRIPVLAALSTGLSCLLGSVLALLAVLYLRGRSGGTSAEGAAAAGMPTAAALTLLCAAPLAAAGASAWSMRTVAAPRPRPGAGPGTGTSPGPEAEAEPAAGAGAGAGTDPGPGREAGKGAGAGVGAVGAEAVAAPASAPVPAPSGLPWGTALTTAGLAVEALAGLSSPAADDGAALLPGTPAGGSPAIAVGWLLTVLGLVLAGPGLTHLCGRLIAAGRPGALRLLSGRVLQEESHRIGRPLGALCAVASGALTATELFGMAPVVGESPLFGPLTALGVALVLCCATASALTAVAESRSARAPATAALLRLGAPRSLLRNSAVLRVMALVVVLAPVAWVIGRLAAIPLGRAG